MIPLITLIATLTAFNTDEIPEYSMQGNFQKGIATAAMGAQEHEVWRASLAVGSSTPRHVHTSEEVFILLSGKIRATVGNTSFECTAPCTFICPANIPHQLTNIGDTPTDQIAILTPHSTISTETGKIMHLPWR